MTQKWHQKQSYPGTGGKMGGSKDKESTFSANCVDYMFKVAWW